MCTRYTSVIDGYKRFGTFQSHPSPIPIIAFSSLLMIYNERETIELITITRHTSEKYPTYLNIKEILSF